MNSIPYNAAMGSLQQLLDTLSPGPRTKGREFELLARWYLENEPEDATVQRTALKKGATIGTVIS